MINKIQIKICLGSSCFSRGSSEMVKIVQKYISDRNIGNKVAFMGDHCTNNCSLGPNIRINGKIFNEITVDNITNILDLNLKDILT